MREISWSAEEPSALQ